MSFFRAGQKCDLCNKDKQKLVARIYIYGLKRLGKRGYTIRICNKCRKKIRKRSNPLGQVRSEEKVRISI